VSLACGYDMAGDCPTIVPNEKPRRRPPALRGAPELVRVFDSAEAALAFLARQVSKAR